jgi:hypothetical protein
LLGAAGLRQFERETIGKQQPVGQAGEGVVVGQVVQPFFGKFALGHIPENGPGQHLSLMRAGVDVSLDRDAPTVFGHERGLEILDRLPLDHALKEIPAMRATFRVNDVEGREAIHLLGRVSERAQPGSVHVREPAIGPDVLDEVRGVVQEILQGFFALPQFPFRPFPFGDIAHDRRHEGLPVGLEFGNGDFYRELFPGSPQPQEHRPFAHRSTIRVSALESFDKGVMSVAKTGRKQQVKRLSNRFTGGIAEHTLGLPVEDDDPLVLIHRKNRVAGRLHDPRNAPARPRPAPATACAR